MDIFAICSQKGGSGKTTTAINLSAALALNKKKVLLIDLDPQAHATVGLNIKNDTSIYDVLSKISKNRRKLEDIIAEVEPYFYLAPSSIVLSTIDQELADEIGRESRLRDVLNSEFNKKAYDFIIIDCPPNLGLLTINALRAANMALIPVEASRFSYEGVSQVLDIITLVCERLDHNLSYQILVSNFDSRLRHSFEILDKIKDSFKGKIFPTMVHVNVKLKEAQAAGTSIFKFDKYSRGAKDFYSLSRDILTTKQPVHEVSMEKITEKFKNITCKKLKEFHEVSISFKAPTARSVYVVGDFNQWNLTTESALEQVDGAWVKKLSLPKGTYQYRFVVDGQWLEDPTNPQTTVNPFGELNSVLEIK